MMKKQYVWLMLMLIGLLFFIPVSAQVVSATVRVNGMI
jgi:hypothetical protein